MHNMTDGQADMLTTLLAFRKLSDFWIPVHYGQHLMCVPRCSHAGKSKSHNNPPAL